MHYWSGLAASFHFSSVNDYYYGVNTYRKSFFRSSNKSAQSRVYGAFCFP